MNRQGAGGSPQTDHPSPTAAGAGYEVVARRYRPQAFAELVGQDHITQALSSAIATERVGHAYLFTGARGTGKTSTARIFAKCLCCEQGPTSAPCNACDICESISRGQDVDVLEIDGASNRQIDDIRQLRANVNVRPSRARYKIYIIDETHMLTKEAFNALLKTLEEPPSHVKFIFCTTDPDKMPITVRSRCQRYDFAPVEQEEILARLEDIVRQERREADSDALRAIARQAAGSMRDSQSLLEQLLAFGGERLTLDDVHRMLGTARHSRLAAMLTALSDRKAGDLLVQIDEAIGEGVEAGQLTEQLLGRMRDLMAAGVGCEPKLLQQASAEEHPALVEQASRLGLVTLLAMMQILDQTLVRMRQSMHPRTLLEMAAVRICELEDLDDLAQRAAALDEAASRAPPTAAGPSAALQKKNDPPVNRAPSPHSTSPAIATERAFDSGVALAVAAPRTIAASETASRPMPAPRTDPAHPLRSDTPASPAELESTVPASHPLVHAGNVMDLWRKALAAMTDLTADSARYATSVKLGGPRQLVVTFPANRGNSRNMCEQPVRKAQLEEAFDKTVGERYTISFEIGEAEAPSQPALRPPTGRQLSQQAAQRDFVKQAMHVFGAQISRTEQPRQPAAPPVRDVEPDRGE